jgi:predicted sulfurtransferase
MNNSEARVVSADDGESSSEDSRCRRQRRKEEHKKRKKQKKEKNNKKKKRSCDDECDQCKKKVKPEDKDDMGDGADGKLPPQETQNKFPRAPGVPAVSKQTAEREPPSDCYTDDKIVQSSALDFCSPEEVDHSDTTLLLFYGYVEPPWDEETYKNVLQDIPLLGKELGGRMRVAREGLNCTLTGTHKAITNFCKTLRHFHKGEFLQTEFKLTRDLPLNQRFPNLKVIPVQELVHYGLECEKAPSIDFTGIHLEPEDYHKKLAEDNTVVIDVRNHYEAIIGHFDAPGAEMLDPMMRKSTEFPVWLDKPEVKAKLKNKQVLMYCTGGVRCERASALLKYKMEKDPEIKELNIQGVYQLQGGIDKYFKAFPEGGFWSGKNYVFDKRFAHAPPKIDGEVHTGKRLDEIKSKCEACGKPWDMFRGKRRCPTCGVPSLICRDCFQKDKSGERKLDRSVRCDLCVSQDIRSKAQLRERQRKEMKEYEQNQVVSACPIVCFDLQSFPKNTVFNHTIFFHCSAKGC